MYSHEMSIDPSRKTTENQKLARLRRQRHANCETDSSIAQCSEKNAVK